MIISAFNINNIVITDVVERILGVSYGNISSQVIDFLFSDSNCIMEI